jgi:hypothetical protein
MRIGDAILSLLVVDPAPWRINWALGLPLIVLTVAIHVFGLLRIDERLSRTESGFADRHGYTAMFVVVVGVTALSAALLHGIEGAIWAAAYRLVGALPDYADAVLYSLGAMTTYGHANIDLEKRWQLMGTLEALDGMLLFGLTTAFLFAIIQKARGLRDRRSR